MKKILLILLYIASSALSYAQNLDFEETGFEIKTVAMRETKSVITYIVAKQDLPSKFTLTPIQKEQTVAFSPFIEQKDNSFYGSATSAKPNVYIAPLTAKEVFASANDGSIRGVKNIAYKPALGGNIYDAYCAAIYASRSRN